MKSLSEIKSIMNTIPEAWRERWCGGEYGACACLGCVQVGNRMIMYEKTKESKFFGDPEYINESSIPPEIYKKYKITKEEWEFWLKSKLTLHAPDKSHTHPGAGGSE